jgi:SHAQKYF class myb-like DNA-binding protein
VQPSLRTLPLQPQQTSRKQRRCWSPELHRRFVNALQKLGGTQGKSLNLLVTRNFTAFVI